MKKTKILLGTVALSAFAIGSLLYQTTPESTYSPNELSFEQKSSQSWNQAAEYYRALRANVNTGQIEAEDYAQAYQHLKNMTVNKTTAFTFVEEGPDNIGGRTRAIEVHPNNDNLIYAGAVTGGLFVSNNGGNTWERVQGWDNSTELLSIASIAITNDGTLYVATGGGAFEGGLSFEGSGSQRGDGLWYSTDNGATFTQVQGSANKDLTKVVADRTQSDVVYVTGTSFGVRKLVNKGSFTTLSGPSLTGTTATRDVKVSPDGNVILVASASKVWSSQDGGNSFAVVSGNGQGLIGGGSSRNECAISYEKNSAGMWTCYVARALSNGRISGVWLSEDNGVTWTRIAEQYVSNPQGGISWDPTAAQGNYNLVIEAVKGNPNQCVLGGLNLYKWTKAANSNPATGTWEAISNWAVPKGSTTYVHADIHRLTWNSQGKLIVGTDGGVQMSIANNIENGFYDSNRGYNVTQFYGIGYGPDGSVIGGAQDNGTLLNNHTGVFSWLEFLAVGGGDGFECELSYLDGEAYITSLYFSGISVHRGVSDMGTPLNMPTVGSLGNPGAPVATFYTPLRLFEDDKDMDTQDSIQFIPGRTYLTGDTIRYTSLTLERPLEVVATQDLFVDYDTTFITTDTVTATFDTLHPGDTLLENPVARDTIMLPDYVQSMFVSHTDLGIFLSRDVLRFGTSKEWWKLLPNSNAHSFEFSKDGNWLWIGTTSGALYRVAGLDSAYSFEQADYSYKDSAQYKLNIDNISGSGSGIITDISIDKDNPDRVIVTRGGTANNNVYYSTNATSANPTWTVIDGSGSNGLPNVPVYGVEFIANASTNETVIVGTEFGAFATENINGTSTQWTPINNEIGLVPVFDVRQQWRSLDQHGVSNPYAVYLGTHGRGIWRSDAVLSVEDNTLADDNAPQLNEVTVFPNPMSDEGRIRFTLNESSDVTIRIYDLQGKMVNQLNRQQLSKGSHVILFDVQALPAGTYIIALESDNASEITKFIKY